MISLLLATMLVQDPTPLEMFKKIEDELQKAQTAKLAFNCKGEIKFGEQRINVEASGTLILKQGNKLKLEMKLRKAGQEYELVLISNGSKVWQKVGPTPPMEGETKSTLKNSLVTALVRVGVETAVLTSIEGGPEALDSFKVSEVKSGADGKDTRTLKFTVSMPTVPTPIDCGMTFEPMTLKVIERTLAIKTDAFENTITERYSEYSLNEDIADELFKFPDPKSQPKVSLPEDKGADVADIPVQESSAGTDNDKRYFLIGPRPNSSPPAEGYNLLVLLPGGDGSAQFLPFAKRVLKNALSEKYLVAELIAIEWTPGQFNRIVWPTRKQNAEKMKFTTEEFVDAVIAEVASKYKINPQKVFTLSWSSGGPAAYAVSLQANTMIKGSFIAMSVFDPETLPALAAAKGHAYYLYQSPQDNICPLSHAQKAAEVLGENGARVMLVTYEGGHGWRGAIFESIAKGMNWLLDPR